MAAAVRPSSCPPSQPSFPHFSTLFSLAFVETGRCGDRALGEGFELENFGRFKTRNNDVGQLDHTRPITCPRGHMCRAPQIAFFRYSGWQAQCGAKTVPEWAKESTNGRHCPFARTGEKVQGECPGRLGERNLFLIREVVSGCLFAGGRSVRGG